MQPPLNTLDTKEPIDYDNLNIVTRPRPPRRRQSGVSLVPFRPYVKCLTSVRQPFSFADGYDKWMVMGRDEIFFTQQNARCIGTLIDDCDISDVIRWDIQGESTRLPMMCKLWMIVDGAVVERGKPHLVQDAAIQVFTAGRNRRAIIAAQQKYNQTSITTINDRRRRHSWHEVNEYHSVPYYQYTYPVRAGFQEGIQCDMDNEQLISQPETLSDVEEETVDDNYIKDFKKENVRERIHRLSIPQDRVHISITTQTESPSFIDRSTSIDSQLIQLFNLNLETNELLLSSIVNPYLRALSSNNLTETISFYRNGIQHKHRSTSTGDDYPRWWLQLTTDLILSDLITNQNEEKEKFVPPPSPRQDQSVQTDTEKSRPSSSSRSSRIQKSSSSTTSNHYQLIDETDDRNNAKRYLTFSDNSQRADSHLSDHQVENSSIHDYENVNRRVPSSKQSDSDYHTFVSPRHQQQQQQQHSDSDYHTSVSSLHQQQPDSDYHTSVSSRHQQQQSDSDYHTSVSSLHQQQQSDSDYHTFVSSLHEQQQQQQQQSYSTPDHLSNRVACHYFPNDTTGARTKSSENTSTTLLAGLLERYERTLRERQRATTIVNNELLDIDDVLKRYRGKVQNSLTTPSNRAMELYRDISLLSAQSKEDRSSLTIANLIKDKYRAMPEITSEEMIQGYIPSPKIHITNTLLTSPRQRQPRFIPPPPPPSSKVVIRPDYCDLCLTDQNTSSAWIRYNEQRIEELQKRIDLMLAIDDNEEAQLLSPIYPTTATVTQRIDDIIMKIPRYRSPLLYYHDRILTPRRYQYRLPYRLHQSVPGSPRLLSRSVTRSTTPVSKSVRISTQSVPPRTRFRPSTSASRPIVSILRRSSASVTPRPNKPAETSHVWRSKVDGKMYVLEQFSIPRYYRLYNDVSFREMYNFSRILDTYLDPNRTTTSTNNYSSMVKSFALNQQLPSEITSAA